MAAYKLIMKESPILVTGCARSGTSMIAAVVNLSGAFGGSMSGPNRNNQKGMYENARIRNTIVKPYYTELGVDRLGQYPLPDVSKLPIPDDWKEQVQDVFVLEGYRGGPVFYKGAKMCQHWPVWHHHFPKSKWVIVRRKTPDIINSCIRTAFMRAFNRVENQRAVGAKNEYDGWLWWVHQHEERFREMINAGLQVMEVWPERMVDGDYSQIKEMIHWLGLTWNEDTVREFIDPKLYHSKVRNHK